MKAILRKANPYIYIWGTKTAVLGVLLALLTVLGACNDPAEKADNATSQEKQTNPTPNPTPTPKPPAPKPTFDLAKWEGGVYEYWKVDNVPRIVRYFYTFRRNTSDNKIAGKEESQMSGPLSSNNITPTRQDEVRKLKPRAGRTETFSVNKSKFNVADKKVTIVIYDSTKGLDNIKNYTLSDDGMKLDNLSSTSSRDYTLYKMYYDGKTIDAADIPWDTSK